MSEDAVFEPAIVQGISMCDYVIREFGTGKCSLIGTFHGFVFPSFPAPPRQFFIHIALTNLRGQIKELNATCRIEVTDSAMVIANVTAKMSSPPNSPLIFSTLAAIDIPFPFPNVVFPSAGGYSIVVLINGDEVARRRIEAINMTTTNLPGKMG